MSKFNLLLSSRRQTYSAGIPGEGDSPNGGEQDKSIGSLVSDVVSEKHRGRGSLKRLNRVGYTMSELIIVMIILAILFVGLTVTYNVHIKNSRIDTVEGNLVIFKSDIEAYLEDYGVFNVARDANNDYKHKRIAAFLNKLSNDYLHLTFDMETIHISKGSFYVDTLTLDPWKSPFRMFYNTDPTSPTVGTCILASAGPNLSFTEDTWSTGDFDDDILVTIVPKIGVVADTGP